MGLTATSEGYGAHRGRNPATLRVREAAVPSPVLPRPLGQLGGTRSGTFTSLARSPAGSPRSVPVSAVRTCVDTPILDRVPRLHLQKDLTVAMGGARRTQRADSHFRLVARTARAAVGRQGGRALSGNEYSV